MDSTQNCIQKMPIKHVHEWLISPHLDLAMSNELPRASSFYFQWAMSAFVLLNYPGITMSQSS